MDIKGFYLPNVCFTTMTVVCENLWHTFCGNIYNIVNIYIYLPEPSIHETIHFFLELSQN